LEDPPGDETSRRVGRVPTRRVEGHDLGDEAPHLPGKVVDAKPTVGCLIDLLLDSVGTLPLHALDGTSGSLPWESQISGCRRGGQDPSLLGFRLWASPSS